MTIKCYRVKTQFEWETEFSWFADRDLYSDAVSVAADIQKKHPGTAVRITPVYDTVLVAQVPYDQTID